MDNNTVLHAHPQIRVNFFEFCKILGSEFFSSLAVLQVPELLEKLREAPGLNFHQGASKSELMGPSYDPKTEILNF